MYCQKCGAIDQGSISCGKCGSREFGPERPEIKEENPASPPEVANPAPAKPMSTAAGCFYVVGTIAFFVYVVIWLFS